MATKKAPVKPPVKKSPPSKPVKKTEENPVLREFVDLMKEVRDALREISIFLEKGIQAEAAKEEPPAPPKKKKESEDESPEALLTGIRQLIQQKVDEGKTSKVVALLNKFGVQNASSLDESDYDAFSEKLKSL